MHILEQMLVTATNDIKDLLTTTITDQNGVTQKALELGQFAAIDSTLFPTFSNPNRKVVTDPDAAWGSQAFI